MIRSSLDAGNDRQGATQQTPSEPRVFDRLDAARGIGWNVRCAARAGDFAVRPGAVLREFSSTGNAYHLEATDLPFAVITVDVSNMPPSSRF